MELEAFQRELEQFRGDDEKSAQAAFDRLLVPSRRYIYALLRNEISSDDRDEIVQTVLLKAWQHRRTFHNQGRPAWFAWLKRITRNTYIDHARTHHRDLCLDYLDEVEDQEFPMIERVMTCALGRELFSLADIVLLKLHASLSPDEKDRRLLAAQCFYLEDWDVEDLLALLSESCPEMPALSRAQLDSWLESPETLRCLAYRELCFSPERLTAHLLNLPDHTTSDDLDRWIVALRAEPESAGHFDRWTSEEAQAILWRYFRGLSAEEILALPQADAPIPAVEALFVKCSERFPFVTQMERLSGLVETWDFMRARRQDLLGNSSGVWHRLAFEYRYRHSLPHRDIHERVYGAANIIDYTITLDMLNAWLSAGLLLNRVRRHYERGGGDQIHG